MAIVLALVMSAFLSHAQSKVFKEVGDEIASTMRVLTQDNALVGYMMFTRLEAVSEDSFAYKIAIMDENLNDIGTVNFREQSLNVHSVSFDQDVICISYLKGSFLNKTFKNKKEYNQAKDNAKFYVVTQFLDLTGKIFKTNTIPVKAKIEETYGYTGSASLKHSVKLKDVPQSGFACFFGDEDNSYLSLYSPKGEELWKKKLGSEEKTYYSLFTSKDDVYLFARKTEDNVEDQLTAYNVKDNTVSLKYGLKDKKTGNTLYVHSFENDPVTHRPYLSGVILANNSSNVYRPSAKQLGKGCYAGLFTINLNGSTKKDIVENFSYWSDGSKESLVDEKGKFAENKCYEYFSHSFKDYEGNTYFVGSGIRKKVKIGSIISTTLLAPFVIPAVYVAGFGYTKYAVQDGMIVKQTPKGVITLDKTLEGEKVKLFMRKRLPLSMVDPKGFYNVSNDERKTQYLVMDDAKQAIIYNISQKKVVRTVPHKDGNVSTRILPAKEGHIMVSEYNKKEKYTRVSIEAL